MKQNSLAEITDLVVAALEDVKGQNILKIDVRGKMSVTDMLVIATGTSDRHVQALADSVVDAAKANGVAVFGQERDSAWVLIDLYDVVVHVMLPETREFYNLEKLWQTEILSTQSQT